MTQHPFTISNAAGIARTLEDVKRLARSASSEIRIGSYTPQRRTGNIGETYYMLTADTIINGVIIPAGTSWNAIGLTNCGIEALADDLHLMAQVAKDVHKPLVVSIAGFSPEDYAEMTRILYLEEEHFLHEQLPMPTLELNLGCPNARHKDGTRHKIISYYPDDTRAVLDAVAIELPPGVTVQVKISPVPDETIPCLAEIIAQSGIVDTVIGVNTIPDQEGLREDGITPALAYRATEDGPLLHKGGMAGTILKQESLRVVRLLGRHLPMDIRTIGCGGIFKPDDVFDQILAGASGVQIGTNDYHHGRKVIGDLMVSMSRTPKGMALLEKMAA